MNFIYKEFVYKECVYVNLKVKFVYLGFTEFIHQDYTGVYLPKVYLQKPVTTQKYNFRYILLLADLLITDFLFMYLLLLFEKTFTQY